MSPATPAWGKLVLILKPSARGRLRAASLKRACSFGSKPVGERLFAETAGLKQAGGCGLPLLRNDRDFRPADPAQDRIARHAPMCDFPNLPSGSTGAAVDNSVEKPFTIVEKLLKEDTIR